MVQRFSQGLPKFGSPGPIRTTIAEFKALCPAVRRQVNLVWVVRFERTTARFQAELSDQAELHPEIGAHGVDSNARPAAYKTAALPTELHGQIKRASFGGPGYSYCMIDYSLTHENLPRPWPSAWWVVAVLLVSSLSRVLHVLNL